MTELIYFEEGEEEERKLTQDTILREFPGATFEDASDEIHWNRFEAKIPEVGAPPATERKFFRLAVQKGFALCCLGIGLRLRIKTPGWMKEELENLRKEKQGVPR